MASGLLLVSIHGKEHRNRWLVKPPLEKRINYDYFNL
jgi:hypothetical protein